MIMNISCEEVLDFLLCGAELFTRRDVGWILAGFRPMPGDYRAYRVVRELEQRELIKRHGRGEELRFAVTAAGVARAAIANPSREWNRPWDGKWRVFGYDLPLPRRKDRQILWRALRARKLGLLQQSIWVWPHDVEPILLELVEAQNIPECFCGFESSRLFLTNDTEIVRAAWNFEEIGRSHQTYLGHLVATPEAARHASDIGALARLARIERQAYQYAFSLDPLLPRALWPKAYQGEKIEQRHLQFRSAVRHRLPKLTG
jgi:DNA-binding transcriptional regulator PaaX